MRGEGKSGNKPIEDVKELRSHKTKLERLKQDPAQSRKTTDGRTQMYQSGMY